MGSVGGDESRETAVRPADAQEAQCNAIRFVADAHDEHVWQKRFCDFNVWNERKRVEKLRYMHRNPVKRGLVESVGVEQFSSIRLRRTRRSARKLSGMEVEDQVAETRGVWAGVEGVLTRSQERGIFVSVRCRVTKNCVGHPPISSSVRFFFGLLEIH